MYQELQTEIEMLSYKREDICYAMIEAEGDQYNALADELEEIENELELKELELEELNRDLEHG